jgi:hypothetical protein
MGKLQEEAEFLPSGPAVCPKAGDKNGRVFVLVKGLKGLVSKGKVGS